MTTKADYTIEMNMTDKNTGIAKVSDVDGATEHARACGLTGIKINGRNIHLIVRKNETEYYIYFREENVDTYKALFGADYESNA